MNKVILFLSAVVVSFSALVATAASLNYEEAMSKGRVAFNDGCIEDALRYFELALEDDMNTPHEREQAKAEIRRCQDILEQRNGVDADARFQDGLISAQQLLMNKKYAECKSKCEELLRIYPNRADELEPLLSRCNAYFAERQAEANAAAEKERQYKAEFSELQYLIIDEKWQEAKNRCETMLSKYPEHKTELKQLYDGYSVEFGLGGNAIDLGLSVLWADRNIDAMSPSDSGDYYAWGEISTKTDYTWGTYQYFDDKDGNGFPWDDDYETQINELTKIGSNIAGSLYDVACQKWGKGWMIPDESHWNELVYKCKWTWTTQNGINGYIVQSLINGNSIFIPAVGFRGHKVVDDDTCYWSGTLHQYSQSAYCVSLDKELVHITFVHRCIGMPIRPVMKK